MTRETLKDVLTAVLIGLALCALVLHSLDALFL
jgi:multisubunit Na+/H+ antiporter MnhC subunit